jgi:aerobic carbon-monoxide dehydrogenase medium subunit
MALKSFSYLEPDTLEEAFELIDRYRDDAKVIAGGTALVNFMKNQLVQPSFVVGLRRLGPLKAVTHRNGLCIGALTSLQTIATAPQFSDHATLLAQACRVVATVRIRNMATLGGAIAYADPALDTPPALLASDARIEVRSRRASRTIPVSGFFKGIYETMLESDELVTEIIIPPMPERSGTAYLKFLPATYDDFATVSVAARVTLAGGEIAEARIALGAVGATAVRAGKAEDALRGARPSEESFRYAAGLAAADLEPFSDFRGSADYKRNMAAVHVKRALRAATAAVSMAVH